MADRPNLAMVAHGEIDDAHFVVVPEGVKVALLGTVGTYTHIMDGYDYDLTRPGFYTWYLPGDIMPRIKLKVISRDRDVDRISIPRGQELVEITGEVDFSDSFGGFRGTVYLMCCLPNSPPEFTPVKSERHYQTKLYTYAPPIQGLRVDPGDALLRVRLDATGNDWFDEMYYVHPSLTPDLFERLVGRNERVSNPMVALAWVSGRDYWPLQGNAAGIASEINARLRGGPTLNQARSRFVPGKTDKKGFGLLHAFFSSRRGGPATLGITLASKAVTPASLAHPVWGAWEVTPIRGGGRKIPAARKAAKRGEVFMGKMSALRGGENVPWVPHMADLIQNGRDWAQRRHSIFSFGPGPKWK